MAPPTRHWSRKAKFGLAATGLGLFSALFIWALYQLRPVKPACLLLVGAGYETNLAIPHNVYGLGTLQGLHELTGGSGSGLFWWRSGSLHLLGQTNLTRAEALDKALREQFEEKTLILFLALHGGTDSKGAYVLPEETEGGPRLYLSTVLDRLKELPENKNKVLILDATQVTAHWPLGMLHNNLVRKVKEELQSKRISNLLVLSASAEDQRSWVAEDYGRTIFGHFVIEGLRGEADRAKDGNKNGAVDAWELYSYVRSQVKDWVEVNRDAVQTPELLAGDEHLAKGISLAAAQPAQPPAESTPRAPYPEELVQAWRDFQELSTQPRGLGPWVYSPHVWRTYQDTLLRYEQLLRAGDPTQKAAELRKSLARWKDEIERAQDLQVRAAPQNAVPLAAALGVAPPWAEADLRKRFDELQNAPEPASQWKELSRWAEAQGGDQESARQMLRVQVSGLIVQRLAQRPVDASDLDRARKLLSVVEGPGSPPRPAEAHYLIMLGRDLDPNHPRRPELLQRALRLRLRAEEAALGMSQPGMPAQGYTEQVALWLKDTIARADEQRRLGEDWLFASDAKGWEQAEQAFTRAEKDYEAAGKQALVWHKALAIRDQVLAALPSYSLWLAQRRLTNDVQLRAHEVREMEALVKATEHLWKTTHELVEQLEKPDAKTALDDLSKKADDVKAEFDELVKKRLSEHTDKLLGPNTDRTQTRWRQIEDLLAVPSLGQDAGVRAELVRKSRDISTTLLLQKDQKGLENARVVDPVVAAKESGQRQGVLALAVLGSRGFDNMPADAFWEKYEVVGHQLNRLTSDPAWTESLTKAGEQLGLRWRQMPQTINEALRLGREEAIDKALAPLTTAEQLCRQIGGAAALSVPADAVVAGRRVRWHQVLLWQAERALADHWFAAEAKDPKAAYYLAAANLYVHDAKNLEPRPALVEQVQKRLKPSFLVATPDGPSPVEVTSESKFELKWKLRAEGEVPRGVPMVWLVPDKPLVPLSGTNPAERKALAEWPPSAVPAYALRSTEKDDQDRPVPETRPTKATLRGLYRGQIIDAATQVNLHLGPDMIVHQRIPPNEAGIAVQADRDALLGSLAIVLDCSGSMGTAEGVKYKPGIPCRYTQATEALGKVLKTVPPGTTLSLWLFGHERQAKAAKENPAVAIIQRRKWNPNETEEIISNLQREVPYGHTPLVRSMLQAKADLERAPELRTLVVLTDGIDEGPDRKQEYPGSIPKTLEEQFGQSAIAVNLVLFQVDREQAEKQFSVLERLPQPGKIYDKVDSSNLAETLELAMRPKLRLLYPTGGLAAQGTPKEGFRVNYPTETPEWSRRLLPQLYHAWLSDVRQLVALGPGDRLLLALKRQGGQLRFERGLFLKDTEAVAKAASGDWQLGVVQNEYRQGVRSCEMRVVLEDSRNLAPGSGDNQLQQVKPTFVWLEVKAKDVERPLGVRLENFTGYPAPTWRIHVPEWPLQSGGQPAVPLLSAWWIRDDVPDALPLGRHRSGEPLEQGWKTASPDVQVDSFQAETRGSPPRPCLVLRLSHAAHAPVLVQASGLDAEVEHRLYSRANKYTALFWDVTEAKARSTDFSLRYVPLEEFKSKAPHRIRPEVLKLEPPSPNSPRPQQVELKSATR